MDLSTFFPFNYLNAGDTWKYTLTLTNYPSDTYSIIYYAKKEGSAVKSFSSVPSADGFSHDILVSSSVSASWSAGTYSVSVALLHTIDGEKTTLGRKEVEVKPDFSKVTDDYDPRTYNRKCFDALKEVIFNGASNDIFEEVFKDHTVKFKTHSELLKMYTYFEMRVQEESGIKTGRTIQKRF